VQKIQHAVEPFPAEHAPFRLDPCPGEGPDPHHRYAGLAHEAGVLRPHRLIPLLRVVVAAELHRTLSPRAG